MPARAPETSGGAGGESFDRLLALVGRLNYTWSNTESLLVHLIAGLAGTDTETALVVFLTLNTSRARVDLVERLAKLDRVPEDLRRDILDATGALMRQQPLRNRYNHCIYAFDPDGEAAHTILMRIADRKDRLKVGATARIDATALSEIGAAIRALEETNRAIWRIVVARGFPL